MRPLQIGLKEPKAYTGSLDLFIGRRLHYKSSRTVENWGQIKDQAQDLIDFMNARNGWISSGRAAYAISHCQVSDDPWNFFVVDKSLGPEAPWPDPIDENSPKKPKPVFPHQVIINAEILQGSEQRECWEGCMSFLKEPRKIKRYMIVTVKYQYPYMLGILKTKTEEVYGLKAQAFQHAIDHDRGENIYYNADGSKKP
jgi:peptide deformylase